MDKKQREDAINEVSEVLIIKWDFIGSCVESNETSIYYHV